MHTKVFQLFLSAIITILPAPIWQVKSSKLLAIEGI